MVSCKNWHFSIAITFDNNFFYTFNQTPSIIPRISKNQKPGDSYFKSNTTCIQISDACIKICNFREIEF